MDNEYLVRVLLYLAQSYHEYFQRTSQNYYKSKKVKSLLFLGGNFLIALLAYIDRTNKRK